MKDEGENNNTVKDDYADYGSNDDDDEGLNLERTIISCAKNSG